MRADLESQDVAPDVSRKLLDEPGFIVFQLAKS